MLEVLARIRHRRTRRQLSPYLDGMLSARESRRLEGHLAQCRACRDELAELRVTVQALAELPLAEARRSFALAAAPRQVGALRPAARRLEFGLRLATAAAAFVLAVVALGDLLGVPRGEEEEPSAQMASLRAAPTETGIVPQGIMGGPDESQAEDKAESEAPTAPPAAAGAAEGEATPAPPATYGEVTPTPVAPPPEMAVPGVAEAETPAPTATPAAAPTPAATAAPPFAFAPAATPAPAETPPVSATPEVASPAAAPETPAATGTPPPVGAQIAPSEPEQQLTSEAGEQAPAEAERETLAVEEGGPSRETVARWVEIGLATGLALLFVSWVLARRRGRA